MKMFLELPDGRVIPTGETYDNLQDSKSDYPWSVFDVTVRHGNLVASIRGTTRNEIRGGNGYANYY